MILKSKRRLSIVRRILLGQSYNANIKNPLLSP
jgi:hypothetical protein